METLKAEELPLHKVFCSGFDFRIPDYQRPYDWDVEHAEQLLGDLVDAMDNAHGDPYFLGSIVMVLEEPDQPAAQIIDGQQRLTTLAILLAVLRDLSSDPVVVTELDAMIVEPGKKIQNIKPKPRLALRERDRDFFRENIQQRGATTSLLHLHPDTLHTDAQRSIQANAEALRKALEPWSESRRLELCNFLNQRTVLVAVQTRDLESAQRIFTVMNSRGKDLSSTDIFKARVIEKIDKPLRAEYAAKWEDAEQAVGRHEFESLFADIRMIFAQEKARVGLLREFQEKVLADFLPEQATDFIDKVLTPYARAAVTIRERNFAAGPGSDEVNRWLRRLQWLDNSDWRPAVLWALHAYPSNPEWLAEFLRCLERLAASMHIRRVYAPTRVQHFAVLMRELMGGSGLDSEALKLEPEDIEATIVRLGSDVYSESYVICRYVLLRLSEALGEPDFPLEFDLGKVTIEHVLPRKPKTGSQWHADFKEAEQEAWKHKLANLVILSSKKNSAVQNVDFEEKKERYTKPGVVTFPVTVQVLSYKKWLPSVLEERQQMVLAKLVELWNLRIQ